jgi:hypothetical protein
MNYLIVIVLNYGVLCFFLFIYYKIYNKNKKIVIKKQNVILMLNIYNFKIFING